MPSDGYPLGIRPDGQYQVVDVDRTLALLVRIWWFLDPPDRARADAAATLERWLRRGLPCRRVGGQLLFDPYQVINFGVDAHLRGEDDTYVRQAVASCRRAVEMAVANGTDAVYEFHFRREFGPTTATRLRGPLPLAPPRAPVEWLHPAEGGVAAPGQAEIRISSERQCNALEYRGTFPVDGPEAGADPFLSDDERVLYTRPVEGLVRVTAAVAKLAAELAGDAASDRDAVLAFWRFFYQRLNVGFVHPDELDAADPLMSLLRSGWCDCRTGASLLISLCRARGIPARLVSGYTVALDVGDDHFWAEVFFANQGWRPIDVGGWLLAAGRSDDPVWSDRHFGWVEPRLVMQRFPRQVMGRPAGPYPLAFYRLVALRGGGTEASFHGLAPDRLLYRDRFVIRRVMDSNAGGPR